MKIAINGFGRIGRLFFRQAFGKPDFDIVGINDLGEKENLSYLLRHDSVYGKFLVDEEKWNKINFSQEKDPAKLPWKDLGVDIVVEATGIFSSYEKAESHLRAGARRAVITAPVPKDDEKAVTFTPNAGEDLAGKSKITSNASCTTNAVTPVATIMAASVGILKASLNTVHGYTATQSLVDGPGGKGDFTRGRAAAINIVPSHTGATIATEKVVPEVKDKFGGVAMRVPVISGSIIDFTFLAKRKTTVEEINDIFKKAAASKEWSGIVKASEESLVSTDIIGEPYGAIVDLSFTRVIDGDLVKVFAWYDNEWGYSAMLVKHIEILKKYL